MNKQEWESANVEEREEALQSIGFGMMARPEGEVNSLAERNWEELPREAKGMWGFYEVKGNETLAFRTNCIDGNDHKPTVGSVLDTCVKCGREIHETSDGSGYWFTDQDDRNWDIQFNGEVKATEVSLDTMHQAKTWWDTKHPDRQWVDMRIGDRQRAILAFLRDPSTVLENFIKGTEENEEQDVALLTQLLNNELKEEEKGEDETEDIALVAQLLDRETSEEEFKEQEHPRDHGKFTSKGGGDSGKAEEPKGGDLLQNIVDAGKAHFTGDRKDYRKESEQIKEGEWKRMTEQERNQSLYARTKMANGGTRLGVKGFKDAITSDELPKELKSWDEINSKDISDSTKRFARNFAKSKRNTKGDNAKDIMIKNTRYDKLKSMNDEIWEDLDFKSGKDVYSRDGMSKWKEAVAMRLNGRYDSIDNELGEWLTDDNYHSLKLATDELKAGIGDNEVEDWWDKSSKKSRDDLMDYKTDRNAKSYDELDSMHQLSMRARYVDRKTGNESKARVIKPGDPDYEKEMAEIDAWNNLGATIKAQGLSKDELKKRGIVFLESRASESVTSWWGSSSPNNQEFRHEALYKIQADTDLVDKEYWDLPLEVQDNLFDLYADGYIGESRASDLKKEIKHLEKFINIASIENPMNMGYKEEELQKLKDELGSLGESHATEGVQYEFTINNNNPNVDLDSVVMRYGGSYDGSKALIPNNNAYNFEEDLKKLADIDYQITSVIDVPVNAQGQVLDAYHPDFKKEDWESYNPVISYAKEDYIPAPYDQHFEWVASMDQDDYRCKHCGKWMYWDSPQGLNALHTAPEHEIIPIVRDHLATHGITESYAKEYDRLDSEGYPICGICGQTVTGNPDVLFDLTTNVEKHLRDHGKSDVEVGQITHKMLMGGSMESYTTEEFKEQEHPREDSGKFTSGGGASGGKHSDKSEKDLVKAIKGGSKDWNDWNRTEKNEELYAEIEKRNKEVPSPKRPEGAKGTIFRDDPDAVSKMEAKVEYLEDIQAYWKKIIKFPHRDYQNHDQLGDAKWYAMSNNSANLRDAKKKLAGIKAQQERGTQLVRKPTYKSDQYGKSKPRFYYSEEPKGEPPEEPWQKGGETYTDITKILKKSLEYSDDERKVSPSSYMTFTEPVDVPNGKNIIDQPWGMTEPETPDGQDLTGITIGDEENKLDFGDKTEEELEAMGADKPEDPYYRGEEYDPSGEPDAMVTDDDKVLDFFKQTGDEEIIEQKPYKPTYHYYKQHPFGVRKDTDSPFGESNTDGVRHAINLILEDNMNISHPELESKLSSWGYNSDEVKEGMGKYFGESKANEGDIAVDYIKDQWNYGNRFTKMDQLEALGFDPELYNTPFDSLPFEVRQKIGGRPTGGDWYIQEAKATEEQISPDTYYYDYSDYWKKGDAYQRAGLTLQANIPTSWAGTEWDELPSDVQSKIRDAGYVTSYEAIAKEFDSPLRDQFGTPFPTPEGKADCTFCGKEFDNWDLLGDHITIVHNDQGRTREFYDGEAPSSILNHPDWTGYAGEGGQGSGRKPYASKDPERKDIHHIGWKNHGIDEYIEDALQDYEEKSEEGRWDDAPLASTGSEDDWNTPAETLGKVQLDLLKGTDVPPEDISLDAYKQGFDWQEGQEQFEDPTPWASIGKMALDTAKDIMFPSKEEHSFADMTDKELEELGDLESQPYKSEEGGKGSGKSGHQSWMRAIEEDHTYDFCENCNMITEQVNRKCDMCGKTLKV